MNGFVKVEEHDLQVIVRVPLDLLRAIGFPLRSGEYDLGASAPAVQEALGALARDVGLWENGGRLAPARMEGRLALPSDRSFESFEQAAAHVRQPQAPDEHIAYDQGYLDARLVYPISSPASVFGFQNLVAADLQDTTRTSLRYMPPGGTARAYLLTGRTGRITLNPSWFEAARGFFALGVEHILTGADHLLFLLCLVIPFRRWRGLLLVITAFTAAHSVTLLGSAFELAPRGAWFPPFVETMIAVSIVYMALENVIGADLGRRWLLTGLFGLVHGFGFSFALKQDLQFAGGQLLASLLAFNVGIEAGQIAVLAVMLPLLALVLRGRMSGRMGIIVLSALVAHTGWHWMVDRAQVLWQAPWPVFDGEALRTLAGWIVGVLAAAGAAGYLIERYQRPLRRS